MPHARLLATLAAAALFLAIAPAHTADRWTTYPDVPRPPPALMEGRVAHDGARIWFAAYGPSSGAPVLLLHGAGGNAENFGGQIPALVAAGRRVIAIDSRGQGHSTWDGKRMGYELMAADVIAVMDALAIRRAAVVGWSDGAILGLILAMRAPDRVSKVFAFGANMDVKGLAPNALTHPTVQRAIVSSQKDYARLSPTPDGFGAVFAAIGKMLESEPNYTAADLAKIKGPAIAIVDGDHEELITAEHTRYLARSIPGAKLVFLKDVSHFALAQDPEGFNRAMLAFLDGR